MDVYLYDSFDEMGLAAPGFNNANITPEVLRDELVKFLA